MLPIPVMRVPLVTLNHSDIPGVVTLEFHSYFAKNKYLAIYISQPASAQNV
jgi:hypothetical protein